VPMAEMGEEGPEAVLPLSRDGQGRLGVRGGGATTNVSVAPSISIQLGNNQGGEGPSEAQARRLGAAIDASVKEKVLEVIERESRPGGILRGSR
jgi:phage-related minor tail protein